MIINTFMLVLFKGNVATRLAGYRLLILTLISKEAINIVFNLEALRQSLNQFMQYISLRLAILFIILFFYSTNSWFQDVEL